MAPLARVSVVLLLATLACGRAPETREYALQGQVLAVRPERREIVIRHEDIEGLMQGMIMPFPVQDVSLLDGRVPGDLVSGTLVVSDTGAAYLSALVRTGHQDLPDAQGAGPAATGAAQGSAAPSPAADGAPDTVHSGH